MWQTPWFQSFQTTHRENMCYPPGPISFILDLPCLQVKSFVAKRLVMAEDFRNIYIYISSCSKRAIFFSTKTKPILLDQILPLNKIWSLNKKTFLYWTHTPPFNSTLRTLKPSFLREPFGIAFPYSSKFFPNKTCPSWDKLFLFNKPLSLQKVSKVSSFLI